MLILFVNLSVLFIMRIFWCVCRLRKVKFLGCKIGMNRVMVMSVFLKIFVVGGNV